MKRCGHSRPSGAYRAVCLVQDSAGAGLGRPRVTGASTMVLHGRQCPLCFPSRPGQGKCLVLAQCLGMLGSLGLTSKG